MLESGRAHKATLDGGAMASRDDDVRCMKPPEQRKQALDPFGERVDATQEDGDPDVQVH